jgi:hypothetical protein
MPIDLAASLPMLLPRAVSWAEAQSSIVLANGDMLKPPQLDLARGVGVVKPEKIRIGVVDHLPCLLTPRCAMPPCKLACSAQA